MTTGLPKLMGRLGIKVAPSSPNVVYVVAETREGYVFRSDDHGETWRKVSDNAHTLGRGFYYADLRVDPQNPDRVYVWDSVTGQNRLSRPTGARPARGP